MLAIHHSREKEMCQNCYLPCGDFIYVNGRGKYRKIEIANIEEKAYQEQNQEIVS
jgi:hypothetical protein